MLAASMLLISFIVISCSQKNIAAKNAKNDKTPALSYTTNVLSIMQTKCTPCHIPSAGGKKKALDNYTIVKENLDDIIRRVELAPHERGFMPAKKPALPAEEIALLKKWRDEGSAE